MRESEAKGEAGLWRVEATLLMIKADSPLQYPACPLDRCGKRVEWLNMQWYCNKCQTLYEVPEYRYIASVMLGDHTGGQWATSFNEVGATLFGTEHPSSSSSSSLRATHGACCVVCDDGRTQVWTRSRWRRGSRRTRSSRGARWRR
jgi:hypothetical protein